MQLDRDGAGATDSWVTVLTLSNTSAAALTADNITQGWNPQGLAGLVLTGSDGGNDSLTGGVNADTISGLGGNDTLSAGYGNDSVDGGAGDDTLSGDTGADTLLGGTGNDYLDGGTGGNSLDGGAGNDTLTASTGNDTLLGGDGNDSLSDSQGANSLDGDAGDDTIGGVSGGDTGSTLTGGTGQDSFVFANTPGYNPGTFHADSITDFATGAAGDTLDIGGLLQWSQYYGGWDTTTNPFTTGYLRVAQSGADTLLQLDRDGTANGAGWVTVATLQNLGTMPVVGYTTTPIDLSTGQDAGGALLASSGLADAHWTVDQAGGGTAAAQAVLSGAADYYSGWYGADGKSDWIARSAATAQNGSDLYSFHTSFDLTGYDLSTVALGGAWTADDAAQLVLNGTVIGTLSGQWGTLAAFGVAGGSGLLVQGVNTLDITMTYVANQWDGARLEGGISVFVPGSALTADNIAQGWNPNGIAGSVIDGVDGGNDSLSGTLNADTMSGLGGNDTLNGGYGADSLDGGGGDDALYGDYGADTLAAGSGNDYVDGGYGDDSVDGGSGSDTLLGNYGNDTLAGGDGPDSLSDQYGANVLDGGAGNDTFDQVDGGDTGSTLTGGGGQDLFRVAYNPGYYPDSFHADVITDFTPGAGGDVLDISGLLQWSQYYGGWNNASNPFLNGYLRLAQSGGDTLLQLDHDGPSGAGSFVTVLTLQNTSLANYTVDNFQPAWAPLATESVVQDGTSGDDFLQGGIANDTLNGLDGNDTVVGYSGDDSLSGGNGNDSIDGGQDNDTIDGGSGDNTLLGGSGNDLIASLDGADSIDAGDGNDTVSAGAGNDTVLGGAGTDSLLGGDGNDSIAAAAGSEVTSDSVDGGAGDDSITGSEGNNTLDGGGGADTMVGGGGNDFYYVGDAGDVVTELPGGGADTVQSMVSFALPDNVEDLQAGGVAAIALAGNTGANVLSANSGGDTLTGGDGNDTLYGGSGNDSLGGDAGADLVYAYGGNDTVTGDGGYDTVYGQEGVDAITVANNSYVDAGIGDDTVTAGNNATVYGQDGNDQFTIQGGASLYDGGAGADVFANVSSNTAHGGAADTLTGGGGVDIFRLSADLTLTITPEVVTDFTPGAGGDVLDLAGILSGLAGYTAGDNPFTGGFLRIVQDGNDVVLQVDRDGGADGLVDLLRLQNVLASALTGANFSDGAGAFFTPNGVSLHQVGGAGAETLTGTPGNDTIEGLDGNDSATGAAGDDSLDGGAGNDTLSGGDGNDTLLGGDGNDSLTDGIGNDSLSGDAGLDTLSGQAGDDTLSGGDGNDVVADGSGANLLHGDGGDDSVSGTGQLFGDDGNDTLSGNGTLDGGTGNDLLYLQGTSNSGSGGDGNDTIWGDAGDVIDGGAGADELHGATGDDTVTGGADNDTLSGGAGNDSLDGGTGYDVVTYAGNLSDYTVTDDGSGGIFVQDNRAGSPDGTDHVVNVELVRFADQELYYNTPAGQALTGTPADDSIYGTDGSDTIGYDNPVLNLPPDFLPYDNSGFDLLSGSYGNDSIYGGRGNDVLDGGAGADTLIGGLANDTLQGGTGADSLVGGGDTAADSGTDDDSLAGGDGNDTLDGGVGNDTLDGGNGDDSLIGGLGNDNLTDSAGANTLDAGTGDDVLSGVGLLLGGDGNDQLYGGSASSSLDGGSGNDTLSGSGTLSGGLGSDAIAVNVGFGLGGSGDDTLGTVYYYQGPVNLDGGDGNDVVNGGVSGDTLAGGLGGDTISGGDGNDSISGGADLDTVTGGTGDDTIDGGGLEHNVAIYTGPRDHYTVTREVIGGQDWYVVSDNRGSDGTDLVTNVDTLRFSDQDFILTPAGAGGLSVGTAGADTILGTGFDDIIQGGAGDDSLAGNDGNDQISATGGNNVMDGGAGNDVLTGGSGHDTLLGGDGDDQLRGGGASSSLDGGAGDDTLTGGAGNDTLLGGDGADSLTDGQGVNVLDGGIGNDTLSGTGALDGGAGDDSMTGTGTLDGGDGNDVIYVGGSGSHATGDAGDDTLNAAYYAGGAITLDGGDGNDSLTGSVGDDTLIGGDGADALVANSGNDALIGGAGNDSLSGGSGNDVIYGGSGADIAYYGGNLADYSIVATSEGTVVTDLRGGSPDGADTLVGVELLQFADHSYSLTASNVGLHLVGTAFDDILSGDYGDDTIEGLAGNDRLFGDFGNESMDGGDGNDAIYGDDGNDTELGGLGDDHLYGGNNDDSLDGGDGNDTLDGGDGNDTLLGVAGDDSLTGSGGVNLLDGGDGNDTLSGNGTLTGDAGFDSISGSGSLSGGDDNDTLWGTGTLDGGNGADVIYAGSNTTGIGGAGNDTLGTIYYYQGPVSLDGGEGDNVISGSSSGDTLVGGTGNDTISGGGYSDGNDSINGGDGANSIYAGAGDDTILSGTGNDTITGAWGNDSIDAGGGANIADYSEQRDHYSVVRDGLGGFFVADNRAVDGNGQDGTDQVRHVATFAFSDGNFLPFSGNTGTVVTGAATNDVLNGGAFDDSLVGLGGNDTLVGNAGHDRLLGGDGNDSLDAGAGNDVLLGGAGSDTMSGGAGDDIVYDSDGANLVSGGDGNDTITTTGAAQGDAGDDQISGTGTLAGGDGNDTVSGSGQLDGGAGNDYLSGSGTLTGDAGNDTLWGSGTLDGGDDNDVISVGSGSTATGGAGDDVLGTIYYYQGAVTLDGGDGNDSLYGSSSADTLSGGTGDDAISGGDGADTIDGGQGSDTVTGGGGNDLLLAGLGGRVGYDIAAYSGLRDDYTVVDHTTAVLPPITVNGAVVTDYVIVTDNRPGSPEGQDTLVGFRHLQFADGDYIAAANPGNLIEGSALADTIADHSTFGAPGPNQHNSGSGDDSITAYAGNDSIDGLAGYDSIDAGDGNDTVQGGSENDTILGGTGDDSIDGGTFDDLLYGGDGNDTILGGDGYDVLYGEAGLNSLDGGNGDDTLFGGDSADSLSGGTGNDSVDAAGGNDTLLGGTGDDTMDGGAGDDTLNDTDGANSLSGGDGNDSILGAGTLDGGAGNDTLTAGGGNDSIQGGDGDDVITGGAGNDTIDGGAGANIIIMSGVRSHYTLTQEGLGVRIVDNYGTDGSDLVFNVQQVAFTDGTIPLAGGVNLIGDAGDNSLSGTAADDILSGQDGNDTLAGLAGNDNLDGGQGNDSLDGGDGQDVLTGGAGLDTMLGGAGDDQLDGGDGSDSLDGGTGNDTVLGGAGDDTVLGNDGADSIDGGDGNDSVDAGLGNDTVLGGYGQDTLLGGDGSDNINGGNDNDSLDGGDGNDTLDGSRGGDTINGGAGNDAISDALGINSISGGTGNDTVFGNGTVDGGDDDDMVGGTGLLRGGAGNDVIYAASYAAAVTIDGGTGNNTMTGAGGADTIFALDGADSLAGGAGNDTLFGGAGNDTFLGGTGDDSIDGGDGTDTAIYSGPRNHYTITQDGTGGYFVIDNFSSDGADHLVNVENLQFTDQIFVPTPFNTGVIKDGHATNDSLVGSTGPDQLRGFGGDDTLVGDLGDDTMDGGPGNDSMLGGDGNDIYYVDQAGDVVVELPNQGTDSVIATVTSYLLPDNVENLTYVDALNFAGTGNALDNAITGNIGNDTLDGQDGNDTLSGGGGADVLLGGLGNDVLHIPNLSFAQAVGGAGNDTLVLDGAALTLNLPALVPGKLQGIEVIDLTGSGNNRLIVSAQKLLDLSDTDTLTVDGNAGDRVSFADGGWVNAGTAGAYASFTNGAATLRVSTAISVDTSLSIAAVAASKPEGNAGATPFTFTVTRSGGTTNTDTVVWGIAGVLPSYPNPADFVGGVAPSGTLTFASGETGKTITVNIQGDLVAEADETFRLILAAPSAGVSIATGSATATIINDDTNLAIVANTPSKVEGNAGATPFTFTVTRSGVTTGVNTVVWGVAGVLPSFPNGTDFSGGVVPGGTLTFAAGETLKTITVNVQGDTVAEPNEAFRVVLGAPTGGAVITTASANATIVNDDTNLAIVATSASKAEGNSGSTPFTFTVTRSGVLTGTNTVVWSTVGLLPVSANGADFTGGVAPGGTLTFAAGETSKLITVNVAGDTVYEADEGFRVVLGAPTGGAVITTASANAAILNDEVGLSVAATSGNQAEGNSGSTPFTFTVTRAGPTAGTTTVQWTASGVGANPVTAADFAGGVIPGGTLTFAAGETSKVITANIAGDLLVEPDEGLRVTLSNATPGATITTASAVSTVLNDDTSYAIAAVTGSAAEGNSGTTPFTFTVSRSGNLSGAGTVKWAAIGVLPSYPNAADFAGGVVPGGTLSFAAGESSKTITVNINGDTTAEPDETFRVVLAAPSAGTTITTGSADATVLNDDTNLSIASVTGSHLEGNSGSTPFVFSVTRSGITTGSNSVSWAVTGALPASVNPVDFVGGVVPSGTVSFAPGELVKNVTVDIAGDTALEPDEWFKVLLLLPTNGAVISNGVALGKVVNDETSMSIAATDAVKAEGDSGSTSFTFTVTRGGNTGGTHTVHWQVTGLNPNTAGAADFAGGAAPSGTLTFALGETTKVITVNVQGDTTYEPDEHFAVLLNAASGGATISANSAFATIVNDDPAPGPTPPSSLVQVASADFTGDGVADLLRQSAAGDLFLLNGADAVMTALSRSAQGLAFIGTGDFNGDGRSDLLLQDGAGGLHDWTMNGASVQADDLVTTLTSSMSVALIRDVTSDGRADIVLQDNAAGAAHPYTLLAMDGGHIQSSTGMDALPDAWRVG